MKSLDVDPLPAALAAFAAGTFAGVVNGFLTTKARLPAFVATLGMFYVARGLAAWMVAGRQLSQFPESFGLIGRKLIEPLRALGIEPAPDTLLFDVASALSTQTLLLAAVAVEIGRAHV